MRRNPTDPDENPSRSHGRRRRWLAFACASLVALVVAEVTVRLAWPVTFLAPVDRDVREEGRVLLHRPSAIPGLAYELAPSSAWTHRGREIAVNALGMRGREVERIAPASTTRVLAMGDSVTFGWDVDVHETWPAQLETFLNDANRRDGDSVGGYQVLNAGVSGYGTLDEALALERRVPELEPDVVVLAYFWNDPEQLPLAPLRRYFTEPEWWQHSHVARLVARAAYERDLRVHGNGDFYRYLHAPQGPCWPRELEALDRVRACVDGRVPRTWIALFPAYPAELDWADYPWRDLHTQVAAAWRERGFEVLDLLPAFESSGRTPRELSVDTEHPNAVGNAVAARAIARALTRAVGAQ